ncbi:MAG TPA: N-acetylmuramoyl-L-alanine amidase [Beijerinckiaceae bacterium]
MPFSPRSSLVSLARAAFLGAGLILIAASAGPVEAAKARLVAELATERSEPATVAIAAEVAGDRQATRLTFTLSRAVEARAFAMQRPDRIILDLAEVNFQLPPETGRQGEGLVAAFRYGLFAPGRSRVVVDLAQPALVAGVERNVRESDGATLLTVHLTKADRASFDKAASQASVPPPAAPAEPVNAADKRPLIVIDPGHGGIDPGAKTSTGVFEKDLVFAFAQRFRERLEATKRYRVKLTRSGDVFIPLDERVRLAREAKADLFVSIHADSISTSQVRGATIYTGSKRATDAESAKLADRENKADAAAGLETGEPNDDVVDILQDLTLRETRGFSRRFAGHLVGELDPVMRLNVNPQREAAFRVLRAPDIPSVLVELGYLSSRKDSDLIASEEWRDKTTAAMTVAIDRFFARPGGKEAAKGAPPRPAAVSP